jgi:hypothetical protein
MSSVNKAGDRGLPKIRRISVNRPGVDKGYRLGFKAKLC